MRVSFNKKLLGFHYYPDTLHYREKDLNALLPKLRILDANWITLQAHPERAIPEPFIRALIENNVTPIIHLPLALKPSKNLQNLPLLLRAYASWGVKYLSVFDRPNLKISWDQSAWSQTNLVDRFLDIFLPIAEASMIEGITPLFPPLEPGGDYWDTMFLQAALESLIKRKKHEIINSLGLTAYAWTHGHDIFWGKGGPEKWSGTRPYSSHPNTQDQFGFFIFDWYQAIAKSTLGQTLPIFLLAAGCRKRDYSNMSKSSINSNQQADEINAKLFQIVNNSYSDNQIFPPDLMACNFWLLTASDSQPESEDAWYSEQNHPNPVINLISKHNPKNYAHWLNKEGVAAGIDSNSKSIGHYILLPKDSCDSKDWLYEVIESISPTLMAEFGHSFVDTLNARRVTIVGGARWVAESIFNKLSSNGCLIEECYGDGTLIATKLLNL